MLQRLKWALTALLCAAAVATVLDRQRVFEAITSAPVESLCDYQASARAVVRQEGFDRGANDSSGPGTQPASDEAQIPVLDDQVGTPRLANSDAQPSVPDEQVGRPEHETIVRTSADGSWSQIWSRDIQPDGTVVETPGPCMDEFTIPPSPTPSGFFDGSVLRAPDSFEWASDMGDPPPFDLNQGVNYQPPPDPVMAAQEFDTGLNQGVGYLPPPNPDVIACAGGTIEIKDSSYDEQIVAVQALRSYFETGAESE